MEKTVGILTFHHVTNYGAVLQCYALQKKINEMGYDCKVIDYICPKLKANETLLKLNRKFLINVLKYISQGYGNRIKRKKFNEFLKEYCNVEKDEQYDIYIVGSDQVWNLELTDNDWTYFMESINSVNKISYAASFGESNIRKCNEDKILNLMEKFKMISVREKSSMEYLSNKGIHAELTCDPVFLLDKKDWKKIISSKRCVAEKYILIYCIEKNRDLFDYAKKIGKIENIKIIYLNQNIINCEKGVEYHRGVGPIEFLNYIWNAELIVTNSFHGTSLSIIFNKNFVAETILHGKENKRIINILKETDMEERTIKNLKNKNVNPLQEIDFKQSNKNIMEIKRKSENFLRRALEV